MTTKENQMADVKPTPLAMTLILSKLPPTPTRNHLLMALRENPSAAYPAYDYFLETQETKMQSLKAGQRYLLKTVCHYYAGIIDEVTLTDVTIRDAEMVFWTGHWPDAAKTRNWERAVKIPDGVVVNLLSVIAAIPLEF